MVEKKIIENVDNFFHGIYRNVLYLHSKPNIYMTTEMNDFFNNGVFLHSTTTMAEETQDKEELSFGKKLVGVTFNPSGSSEIDLVKSLFAGIADMLAERVEQKQTQGQEISEMEEWLFNHALGEILNAQMNCVKFLTFKY